MKKNTRMICFAMAAAFLINAAQPVYASQLIPPGAGPGTNTGPGINNTLPGNTAPGAGYAAPGRMPGNTNQGVVPGNTVPGALRGNTVPGAMPGVAGPGTMPGAANPGTAPGAAVPGAMPNYANPGTAPGNAIPGALPGNTVPGALPGNMAPRAMPGAAPGTIPGNAAQGTVPGAGMPGAMPGGAAPGTQGVPGRQPGYNTAPGYYAPGTMNPNSPYNSGVYTPGTGAGSPQVGGVTNDPGRSGETWQNEPFNRGPESGFDPVTGRTRPLLKAEPIPGEMDVYYVHLHDTLWIIAQKYRIRLDAVIDANPELPDPDLIYPGDQIKVPLNPKSYESMDIAAPDLDKGDGSTHIRSNIVQGRYSGVTQQTQENPEEKELLELVNNERAKAGLPSLKLSAAVSTAARIKADEMSVKKYFDHTSPIYGTPFEMLRAFGISYRTAGENIAKGQKTANAVMGAWMNSEGHRGNILNKGFTEIGIGYANDGKTPYWVQIFIGK